MQVRAMMDDTLSHAVCVCVRVGVCVCACVCPCVCGCVGVRVYMHPCCFVPLVSGFHHTSGSCIHLPVFSPAHTYTTSTEVTVNQLFSHPNIPLSLGLPLAASVGGSV